MSEHYDMNNLLFDMYNQYKDYTYQINILILIKIIQKNKDIDEIEKLIELEKDKTNLTTYGFITLEHDKLLESKYGDTINKIKDIMKNVSDDDFTYDINMLNDEEIILFMTAGFFDDYFYEHIDYLDEFPEEVNYINIIINRFNNIHDKEEYKLYFKIFNLMYKDCKMKYKLPWL